jgi:hypothetical protein
MRQPVARAVEKKFPAAKASQVSSLVSPNRLLGARSFCPFIISTLLLYIHFNRVRVAPKIRTGRTGVRISGEEDFLISKHVQADPGSHPASTAMAAGVLTQE